MVKVILGCFAGISFLRGGVSFADLSPTRTISSCHPNTHPAINIVKMEEDRAVTNLGPTAEDGFNSEVPVVPKQPKKRFVGRKQADRAAGKTDPNANIEDSGAIQGIFCGEFISSDIY